MASFYNPKQQTASSALLKQAAGVGQGDILRKGTKGVTEDLTKRAQGQYTTANKDALASGDLTKLLALDQSQLTPEAAQGIQARLPLLREQRAATTFGQEQKDREASQRYRQLLAQPKAYTDFNRSVTPEMTSAVGYSKPELQALAGGQVPSRPGLEPTPLQPADTEGLLRTGATPEQIASIQQKTKQQELLGSLAGSDIYKQTETEQLDNILKQFDAQGLTPPEEVLTDIRSRRAAAEKTKTAAVKQQKDLLAGYTKEAKKANFDLAKVMDKANAARGTGTSGGKQWVSGKLTDKDVISERVDKVSTWLGKAANVGDASDVASYFKVPGWTTDKAAYIVDSMKDDGVFGNNVYGVDEPEGQAEIAKYAAQYDRDYGRKGKSGTFSGSNTIANLNSTQKDLLADATEAKRKLDLLNLNTGEARDAYTKNQMGTTSATPEIVDTGAGKNVDRIKPEGPVVTPSGYDNATGTETLTESDAAKQDRMLASSSAPIVKPKVSGTPLLGGYTAVPSAPVVKPSRALTEAEKRKSGSWAGKVSSFLSGEDTSGAARDVGRDVLNRGLQAGAAGWAGLNRGAEFFSQPLTAASNWYSGTDTANPFGTAATEAENYAVQKLIDRGASKEDAIRTVQAQGVLTPGVLPYAKAVKAESGANKAVRGLAEILQGKALKDAAVIESKLQKAASRVDVKKALAEAETLVDKLITQGKFEEATALAKKFGITLL